MIFYLEFSDKVSNIEWKNMKKVKLYHGTLSKIHFFTNIFHSSGGYFK